MVLGQWPIVHLQCNERIGVCCLLERNAANERRHFARNFVQPAKHDVFAVVLHAGTLQQIMPSLPGTWTGLSSAQNDRGKTSTAATVPDTCFRKLRRESIE